MNDTVQILLATFNGERFLREQIDSLLAQSHRPLRILARDDGSTDSTPTILADYAYRFPEIFQLAPASAPTGSARANFQRLLQSATEPYLAFADQDDVWHPEKISQGMAAMHRLEARHVPQLPLLVFSDLAVVDDRLHPLHPSFWANDGIDPTSVHRLSRLLVQNVVTGCTALINQPLAQMACRMPKGVFLHDWWIALLACCFGAADPLPESLVRYRQHSTNLVGAVVPSSSPLPSWRNHTDRLRQLQRATRQAHALLKEFDPKLTPPQRETISALAHIEQQTNRLSRLRTALHQGFRMNSARRTLTLLWLLWDLENAQNTPHPESG